MVEVEQCDYLVGRAGCREMCQMALKQISPDVIGQWAADYSLQKIRFYFEVDSHQYPCL